MPIVKESQGGLRRYMVLSMMDNPDYGNPNSYVMANYQKCPLTSCQEASSRLQHAEFFHMKRLKSVEQGVLHPFADVTFFSSYQGVNDVKKLVQKADCANLWNPKITLQKACYEELQMVDPKRDMIQTPIDDDDPIADFQGGRGRISSIVEQKQKSLGEKDRQLRGYILLSYKTMEDMYNRTFVTSWKTWTGVRYICMTLPRQLGLRRISFYRQITNTSNFTYVLIIEINNLLSHVAQTLNLMNRIKPRLCGYVGIYREVDFMLDQITAKNLNIDTDFQQPNGKTSLSVTRSGSQDLPEEQRKPPPVRPDRVGSLTSMTSSIAMREKERERVIVKQPPLAETQDLEEPSEEEEAEPTEPPSPQHRETAEPSPIPSPIPPACVTPALSVTPPPAVLKQKKEKQKKQSTDKSSSSPKHLLKSVRHVAKRRTPPPISLRQMEKQLEKQSIASNSPRESIGTPTPPPKKPIFVLLKKQPTRSETHESELSSTTVADISDRETSASEAKVFSDGQKFSETGESQPPTPIMAPPVPPRSAAPAPRKSIDLQVYAQPIQSQPIPPQSIQPQPIQPQPIQPQPIYPTRLVGQGKVYHPVNIPATPFRPLLTEADSSTKRQSIDRSSDHTFPTASHYLEYHKHRPSYLAHASREIEKKPVLPPFPPVQEFKSTYESVFARSNKNKRGSAVQPPPPDFQTIAANLYNSPVFSRKEWKDRSGQSEETEIKTPLTTEAVGSQRQPLVPLPQLAPQRVRDVVNPIVAPQQIAIDMTGGDHTRDPYSYTRRSNGGIYVPPETIQEMSPPPQRKRSSVDAMRPYLGESEEPQSPPELPLGALTRLKTKRKSISTDQEEMLREEIEQVTRMDKIRNREMSLIALGGEDTQCPPPAPMRPPDVAPPPNEPPRVPPPESPLRRMLPQPPTTSQGKKKRGIPMPTKSQARSRGRSKSPSLGGRRPSRQLPKIP